MEAVSSDQFRIEEFLWLSLPVFLAPFLKLANAIIFFFFIIAKVSYLADSFPFVKCYIERNIC